MHIEVLTKEQQKLLPLIAKFKKDYILVGGTAIALYLGHRYSIDFDMFSFKEIKRKQIKNIILNTGYNADTIIYEAFDQMHLIINGIKVTFFQFPHKIQNSYIFNNHINIPDLITLAAMKAYALGGRAKWKDYVDLYFIITEKYSVKKISEQAKNIFGNFFNHKLFKEQLSYFEDIDYSEPVIYLSENHPTDNEIKSFLTEQAIIKF